tara:strand:- start:5919 stop:6302 length:384 start_codon:yes stop_codon:yes gene_type:complete
MKSLIERSAIMQITYNKKRYKMSTNDLMAWGGYIPLWVVQWNLHHAMGSDESLLDHLDKCYKARAGMGIKERPMGGEIDSEGVYRYPEDEPMYPYMTWDTREGQVYFYPYSVMGIPDGDKHYATRMD